MAIDRHDLERIHYLLRKCIFAEGLKGLEHVENIIIWLQRMKLPGDSELLRSTLTENKIVPFSAVKTLLSAGVLVEVRNPNYHVIRLNALIAKNMKITLDAIKYVRLLDEPFSIPNQEEWGSW